MDILANSPHDFSAFEWCLAPGMDIFNEPLPLGTREDLHKDCFTVFQLPNGHVPPSMTSRGLRITQPLLEYTANEAYMCLTLIDHEPQPLYLVCVPLLVHNKEEGRYIRKSSTRLALIPHSLHRKFRYTTMYVDQPPPADIRSSIIDSWDNKYAESILLVKIDPALVPDLAIVASPSFNLRSILQEKFGKDAYPDTSSFQIDTKNSYALSLHHG
jgi:hypothetical protein